MKTSSPFLWQLIRSLNSSEKLFFKRNYSAVNRKEDKTYLKLFSAISAQKNYDETEILIKLSPAVNKKNIAYQKHYLQQQICDAIIQYDGKNDAQHDIYNQIQLIRVLRKKGLLKEAHNAWKKTTDKARKVESFALLNLLKTEFEKMVLFSSSQMKYDELHTIFKKNAITYAEYANLITLRDIYTETILLKRKAHFDIDEDLKKRIATLLEQIEYYSDASHSTSFWYCHYYYMSKATLLYINNSIDESLTLLKLVLTKWHKDIKFLRTGGEFYVELLYMINYTGVLQGITIMSPKHSITLVIILSQKQFKEPILRL
ncbi:MAG: hypothetical protein IPH18_10480 [Chitinophagaceae bacterium]|nr:hypothetical protein [Chitinophagaceae bacterium]